MTNLKDVLKCFGLTSNLISEAVNDWFILHFSFKENRVERIDFETADDCYDAFQHLCSSYEDASYKDRSKSVDFPNEGWNDELEEPTGYGDVLIALTDGVVTDYYELVNPDYYV